MKKITQNLTKLTWHSSLLAVAFLFSLTINAQVVGQEYLTNPGVNTTNIDPDTGYTASGNFNQNGNGNYGGWDNGAGGAYAGSTGANGQCHSPDRQFKFFKVGGASGQYVNQTMEALPAGNYNFGFWNRWDATNSANEESLPTWSADGDSTPKFVIKVQDAEGAWVNALTHIPAEPTADDTWTQETGTWTNDETRDVRVQFYKNGGTSAAPGNLNNLWYVDTTTFNYASELTETSSLALQGILDIDGGYKKAVHVRATADIADLSVYKLQVYSNANATAGASFTLSGSASAGDDILIANDGDALDAYMSTSTIFDTVFNTGSFPSINGDDSIELLMNDASVEVFGNPGTDGSNEPWEYQDSWAYKVVDAWTYGGVGCTDGSDTTWESSCVYPLAIGQEPVTFTPPTWAGDWILDPVAGALAVGPNAGSVGDWYASSAGDVDTRACLFDDIHRFNADGSYEQIMQDQTWLEGWQGVAEGCGTPVAPHNGSNAATYTYTDTSVTVIGDGAFMGLAKVHNTGEDGVSGGEITYNVVSVDENYMVVNIAYAPGADNTWQFMFRNAAYTPPAAETTDVTFTVNTSTIEVGANGMYLGGGILGGANAYAMTDADEDGTWEVTITMDEGTTGNYIFLNSPNAGDDWGAKEDLVGQECADGQFSDRLLAPVGADDYTLQHCFGSCESDGSCPAEPAGPLSDSEQVCATGADADPITITLTPDDLTVNNGGNLLSVSVTSGTIGSATYVGTWYDANLTVTGGVSDGVTATGLAEMAGLDITGFTSVTMTSVDLDAYADTVDMCLNLLVSWEPPTLTGDEAICATGADSDPTTITLTPDDLTVNEGQEITAVSVTSGTIGSATYVGTWYDANLTVTGGVSDGVTATGLAEMAGLDITGFTSVTMTSVDLDAYADTVEMCLNLSVTYVEPSCTTPTDLTVSDISTTGALLSWVSDGSQFMIEIQPAGSPQGTEGGYTVGDVDPYPLTYVDLTGFLADNTAYDIYVINVCGDISSAWAGPATFTTLALPIVPDYTNDFTEFPGDLWSTYSPNGSSASTWLDDGFANDGATGAAKTNVYSSNNIQVLESPIFDLTGGTFYLNMKAAVTAWNGTDALAMGSDDSVTVSVSVDGGDYEVLHTWNESNNPGPTGTDMPEVDLTNYSSANVKFAITMSDGTVNDVEDYDFFIDDFSVTAPFVSPTWAGDWQLDPTAGSLAVGPNAGDLSWWSSNADTPAERACLFDDIYRFGVDGTFENVLGDQTWLEGWQEGQEGEGCGAPIAPHDGSNAASYTYTGTSVTVSGSGAFLGLAKVHNAGEDGAPAGDTITYEVISVDETYMTVHINFGGGVWAFRFINSTALGIDDVNPVSSFNFFPNPVNDVLTIKAQASIDSITVYNMLGQAVVRSTPNTTDSTVDMSALQTGAYFVQVSINNTVKTVRVIKN